MLELPFALGHAAPLSHVTTCANRPCFPGVLCFDRKPPYIGYVCGRCPPGFFGNGRICSKVPRPGTYSFLEFLKKSFAHKGCKQIWTSMSLHYNVLYSQTLKPFFWLWTLLPDKQLAGLISGISVSQEWDSPSHLPLGRILRYGTY